MSSNPPPPFEPSCHAEYAGWFEMIHSVVAFVTASTHLATVLRNNHYSFAQNVGLVKVIETITGSNNLEYYSPLDFPWFLDQLNNVKSQTKYLKSPQYPEVIPLVQYPMFDGVHGEPDREPRTFRLVDTKDFGDINFNRSSQSFSISNRRNNNSFDSSPSEEKPKSIMKYKSSSDSCFFDEYSDSDQTINSSNLQEDFEDFEDELSKGNARLSSGGKRKSLSIRDNTTTENYKTVLRKSEEVEQYSTVYKVNEYASKHSNNDYSTKNLDNGYLAIYSSNENQCPVMKSEDSPKGSESDNEVSKLEYSSKGSQHLNSTNISDEINHTKAKSESFTKELKDFDEQFENLITKLNHSTGRSQNSNTIDLYMDCTVEDPHPKEVRKDGMRTGKSYDNKSVTTYVDNIEVILKATKSIDKITSELSSKYGESTQVELSTERAPLKSGSVELTDEKCSSVANFSVGEEFPQTEEPNEVLTRTHEIQIPSGKAKQRKNISGKGKQPIVATLSEQKRDYKNKYLGDIVSVGADAFIKKSVVCKKLEPPSQKQIPKKVYTQSVSNKTKSKVSQEGSKLKLKREYGCEVDYITKNIVNCLNVGKKSTKISVNNNKTVLNSLNNSSNSSDKEKSTKKPLTLIDTVKAAEKGLTQPVGASNQTPSSDQKLLKPTDGKSLSADTVTSAESNKQTIQQKKQIHPKKPVVKSVSNKERPSLERDPTASNIKSKIPGKKLQIKSCIRSGCATGAQKNCVLSEIVEEYSTRPTTTTVTSRQEKKVSSRQEKKERILPKMTLVRDTTLKLTAAQNMKKASALLKNVDDMLRPATAIKEKVIRKK